MSLRNIFAKHKKSTQLYRQDATAEVTRLQEKCVSCCIYLYGRHRITPRLCVYLIVCAIELSIHWVKLVQKAPHSLLFIPTVNAE